MKAWFMKFFLSKSGGIITPILAGLITTLVAKLSVFAPDAAATVDVGAVAGFLSMVIVSAISFWTNAEQEPHIKQIQAMANVPVDGYVGPVTFTEVRRAMVVAPQEREELLAKEVKVSKPRKPRSK